MQKALFLGLAALVWLPAAPAQVKLTQGSDRILVEINGKPFTDLFIGSDAPKPYLHPLRAATGTVITRYYPMDLKEGEAHDHKHHRGLWFTHGDVSGVDFWANEPDQKRPHAGRVVLRKVNNVKGGKKSGVIEATFDWTDPKGKTLVTESRKMTFYAEADTRTIDFDIALRAVEAVKFNDTKEGTFAIRLAAALEEPTKRSLPNPPRTGQMVNAEGLKGEEAVWGKRSPWVDYAGVIDGEKVGVAILDHPSSFNHPTWWHSRGYGLFAANAFGERDFTRDKSRNGTVDLQPGQTLTFRYRVIIHPGDWQSSGIAAQWQKYSKLKYK
ncbi:MAG: PmoA family protein [Bryobacterales bacterium]|jgi:hypothetical protein|nr:PmoA family protein [Bryobacterales bacterium]